MPANRRTLELSDAELLQLIKDDPDYISVVFKKTRDYCLGFMRNMTTPGRIREEDLKDIYQDALIVLIEKIADGNFSLTSSFQTYLNSVCRNLLLKRFNGTAASAVVEKAEMDHHWGRYDPEITDVLQELEIEENSRFAALETALKQMKEAGGRCFELLSHYWYHKWSMAQLAEHFGYTSEVNARNQKSRCQKRLRRMAHSALNLL